MSEICMNCGRGEWKHCGAAGCKNFVPFPDRSVNEQRIAEKKPLSVGVLVGGSQSDAKGDQS